MDQLPRHIRRMHVIDGIFVGDKQTAYLLDSFREVGITHALVLSEAISISNMVNVDIRPIDVDLPVQHGQVHIQIDDPTLRFSRSRRPLPVPNALDLKKHYEDIFDRVYFARIHRDARIPEDILKDGIEFVCKNVKAGHKLLIITDNVVYGTPMLFVFGYLLNKGYPLPELVRGMVAKVNVPRLYRHHWEQLLRYFKQPYTYDDVQKWVLEGWEARGAGV